MRSHIIIILLALSLPLKAQVFKLPPKYSIHTAQTNIFGWYKTILSADTFDRGNIIIDLDQKKLIIATTKDSNPRTLEIDDIKYNKSMARYDIKIKMEKDDIYKYRYFRLQMNPSEGEGKVKYLREATAGEDNKPRDTTFHTYTNNFHFADWTRHHFSYAEHEGSLKEFKEFTSQDNVFEVENGVLTWTSGKGKDKVKNVYPIELSEIFSDRKEVSLVTKGTEGQFLVLTLYQDKGYNQPFKHYLSLAFYDEATEKVVKTIAFK